MLITDTLLVIALVTFCSAWLWRILPHRNAVLWATAGGATVLALLGVLRGRWQAAVGGLVAVVFLLVLAARLLHAPRAERRLPILSGAPFLLLTAVAFLPLWMIPVLSMPEPDGPHPIGVRQFELTDHNRLGVLFSAPDEPRRLAVRVWYPAATTAGYSRRPYATDAEMQHTFPTLATEELGMPSFFYSHLKGVETNSYQDAPVLADGPQMPVVFFSHGLNGYVSQNTVLMEHLASNGYVVFSIAHPYDAAPVVFADGDVVRLAAAEAEKRLQVEEPTDEVRRIAEKAGPKQMAGKTYQERFEGSITAMDLTWMLDDRVFDTSPWVWVDDVLFVEDTLAAGHAPEAVGDIVERADFTRVGHIGHSYGGSTAAAVAYEDPRAAAAVNLDGSDFHLTGWNADIPVPLMMLYSNSIEPWGTVEASPPRPFGFNDFLYERFETAGTRNDVSRLRVEGVTHIGVTDSQLVTRGPLHTMLNGRLDGGRALEIVNRLVGDFLDQHLRGATTGLPAPQLEAYDGDVVLHDVSGVREWWRSKAPADRTAIEAQLDEARSRPMRGFPPEEPM